MDDFEQFQAFQTCREFVRAIAGLLNRGAFSKDPVLATQLRKTMLSIYSNFAEGFERDGNREFAQFVSITKGSVGETLAQLLYALDFGRLPNTQSQPSFGVCQYRTTSRQSSDSSAIIITTASPFMWSNPQIIALPKACCPSFWTGASTGIPSFSFCKMAQVSSLLPSSTTTIS